MTDDTLTAASPAMYTVPQAAQRLLISTRKTWRLIAQRELPVVKIGERGTRVLADDLAAYVERLRSQSVRR